MPLPKYFQMVFEKFKESEGIIKSNPGVYHSVVEHDNHCNILSGKGHCNCEPHALPPMTEIEYQKYLKKE